MVNAGRILIMPRGEWDNLQTYEMLDLVTDNRIAYIARQASVGMQPSLDVSQTYWQTFGESVIDDSVTTPGTTWSSYKIDSEINTRIDTAITQVLNTPF